MRWSSAKGRFFQHAIGQADAELLLAQRHGEDGQGIFFAAPLPFTFKAVLGTVKVRRQCVEMESYPI